MITICARWEELNLCPVDEWRVWRQLRGAFKINDFKFVPIKEKLARVRLEQYETMEEALAQAEGQGTFVFLEPNGDATLDDIAGIEDIVLILGSSSGGNKHLVGDHLSVRINTPGRTDMYAFDAAAIALAHRHGQ